MMKKLLFIKYKKSSGILEGGDQGSQKNYNVLSKILGEENIHMYYIHDKELQSADYFKKSIGDYIFGLFYFLQNYYFGLTKSRVNEIVAMAGGYDYIFIDRSVFGIIAKKLKEAGYRGKIITFFHNIEVMYFDAKIPKHAIWRKIVLRCVDANDRYSCQYSDRIIALNQRDENELAQRYNRKADVLVPVAFKDRYKRPSYSSEMTSDKPLCIFLGAYFIANNEGVQWFIREVYPHVNINLKIVGKGMSQLKTDFEIPSEVEVISDVPDLMPYFEMADIMILPIFKGSGMKVKTCESLMYGKNIIGSTEAFEGYEVDYTRVGGRCDSREEFISCVNDFERNPRPRFNAYSRQQYLEKYSEEAVENKFLEVLQ